MILFIFIEITSLSTNTGSLMGGTYLTIQGPYLYTDSNVPADIRIGGEFKWENNLLRINLKLFKKKQQSGQPCPIISFTSFNSNTTTSSIVCQVPVAPTSSSQEYEGNRGITLIVDYGISTSSSNLATVQPSSNAQYSEINMASYTASTSGPQTVWFKGFLASKKMSSYKLSLVTNGVAELYLSNDSTSANKVKIASTSTNTSNIVQLNASRFKIFFNHGF